MSIVRVAIPVLVGRRRFHFDKGRPWSILERVVLTALIHDARSASQLATDAVVPRRLVVESLIRLMRAGWVQMQENGAQIVFRATQSGLAAVVADDLPSVTRRMKRTMAFVVEQVSGGVFRRREFLYLPTHMVQDRASRGERIVWIERPKEAFTESISPLLEALFSDDERFVGMDASGERLAERWSLISVKDGEIDGLSHRASGGLINAVLEAADRAPPHSKSGQVTVQIAPQSVPAEIFTAQVKTQFGASDILIGGSEHKAALESALRKARHRVIIHSTFIDRTKFEALLPALRDAHNRGAKIDILWGQSSEGTDHRSTHAEVRFLRERVANLGLDCLRVHPFSTGSHCKMIVSDVGSPQQFQCVVGSCNWLYSGFNSIEVSGVLRDPRLVADSVTELAELSRVGVSHWTEFTNELSALAVHLRSLPLPSGGGSTVSLVKGTQHADLVRQARDEAKKRIVVLSHRFSKAAKTAVLVPALAAANGRGVATEIFYGRESGTLTGTELSYLTVEGAKNAIKIVPVHNPSVHAKVLAWDDDSLVITSQNFLSADPPDDALRQEIGVFVQAKGLARLLVDRFKGVRL